MTGGGHDGKWRHPGVLQRYGAEHELDSCRKISKPIKVREQQHYDTNERRAPFPLQLSSPNHFG